MNRKVLVLLAGLCLVCFVQSAFSQVTSSSVFGTIADNKKAGLVGATIVYTYVPTGLKYGTAADDAGRFNIANMNPGGPYTVEVKYVGFKDITTKDVYLTLGTNSRFDYTLLETANELAEVAVVTTKNKKTAGSEFNEERISSVPTLNRNITDITKLTPQSNNNSFAGTNFRYNNVTLDGAINNDAIGFSPSLGGQSGTSNMTGSTTRTTSFSLDAIQEVQTSIAPYDVKLGNFTGGSINAVSRSGSNNVTGSVYGYGRFGALAGKFAAGDNSKLPSSAYDYQVGFRLGLPLIKNKLFFFTNEEVARHQEPTFYNAGDAGTFMTDSIAKVITSKLADTTFMPKSKYNPTGGYDPGAAGQTNIHAYGYKFFNRLDYIISDKHQLSLRNNTVVSEATNRDNSNTQFQFANYDFTQKNLNVGTVMELKSRINNRLSNSVIVGFTYVHDYRNPLGQIAPNITINNVNGTGQVFLGTNREAGIFNMKQQTIELTDNVTYYKGKHKFTFGTHNEIYKIDYGFINSWNGRIDYNNMADFVANKPARVRAIYNPTDDTRATNIANYSASFWIAMLSFYAQDEIALSKKFNLSVGLRIDETVVPKGPLQDTNKVSFPNPPANYGSSYSYGTPIAQTGTKLFGGMPAISPRVGFNYDIMGNQKVVLRGGTGIFSGRIPFAWMGYAYYNNGVGYNSIDVKNGSPKTVWNIPTDPTQLKTYSDSVLKKTTTTRELDLFAKDFKMPQVWRTSLAVDFKIPGDVKFTLEGLFTKTIYDVMIQQVNLRDSVSYAPWDVNKVQPIYTSVKNDTKYSSVYLISNTQQGYRYSFTVQAQKKFKFGLDLMAAYTYGKSKDILNGIRNSPESGWQLNQATDPNRPTLTNSNFDIPHRIVATVSFHREWTKNFGTTIALVYTGSAGNPYTWVNGNNTLTNNGQQYDLMYVPKDTNDIYISGKNASLQSASQQKATLDSFITNNKYLNSRRGQYTERNGARTPWNHNLDFRLIQDFNFYSKGNHKHTIQVTFDIINLANLFDSKAGWSYFVPNTFNAAAPSGLQASGVKDASGRPGFTFNTPTTLPYSVDPIASRWQGQIGLRYNF